MVEKSILHNPLSIIRLFRQEAAISSAAGGNVDELGLFQKRKVVGSGDAAGAQIVHDDENRYGSIAWNHNGAGDPWLCVDAMVSFFPHQDKTGKLKHTAQALIREGG